MHRILVVEDEPTLSESLQYQLEREGYQVVVAADGHAAFSEFRAREPSLVLLDLMIPKLSGLDLCRLMRAESTVPIIILTAKGSESEKVAGLELGADDYVTKPFLMRELVARVRANLRRVSMAVEKAENILSAGDMLIDPDRHIVQMRGHAVRMTPKEFALLQLLVERKGRLLTRDFLIDEVWGPEFNGVPTTLDVHIRRLREKIETDPREPRHIVTVRGLGYKFLE